MAAYPRLPNTPEPTELLTGVPSTTKSGWLFPVRELAPRMTIRLEPPAVFELKMLAPASLPESEATMLGSGTRRESVSADLLDRGGERPLLPPDAQGGHHQALELHAGLFEGEGDVHRGPRGDGDLLILGAIPDEDRVHGMLPRRDGADLEAPVRIGQRPQRGVDDHDLDARERAAGGGVDGGS